MYFCKVHEKHNLFLEFITVIYRRHLTRNLLWKIRIKLTQISVGIVGISHLLAKISANNPSIDTTEG
jgi:hypothetical protein